MALMFRAVSYWPKTDGGKKRYSKNLDALSKKPGFCGMKVVARDALFTPSFSETCIPLFPMNGEDVREHISLFMSRVSASVPDLQEGDIVLEVRENEGGNERRSFIVFDDKDEATETRFRRAANDEIDEILDAAKLKQGAFSHTAELVWKLERVCRL